MPLTPDHDVIATDAPVDARNLKRMGRAMMGLPAPARRGYQRRGDYAIAFSAHPSPESRTAPRRCGTRDALNEATSPFPGHHRGDGEAITTRCYGRPA
jgi:hypothetical protein